MQKFLSIIVCTYNRDKYIFDALCHIASNNFAVTDYEIILINNNSTDNTETLCRKFEQQFPTVNFKYIVETQQGLSYARNRGIAEASGNYLIFLDDDSFVKNDYLQNIFNQLHTHNDAMVFGGKITPRFESGEKPKWLCRWTYSWVSAIDMGKNVRLFSGNKYPIGANMGFKRECFEQCGVFNTQLGRNKNKLMAGEEKDLFYRIKSKKIEIYYFPDIEVEHVIPPQRTKKEYIVKMAQGIGQSEKIRCNSVNKKTLYLRYISEAIKWCATLVLWGYYTITMQFAKGNMLVLFRYNVTKNLIK